MANEVYANGMEIACKAASGKTIAALPDVCLSPPSPPAGPIPIPYPNTAYASDTAEGSKTVQISGQEVMLKDKSYFKKSTGDEAATKSLGMGVVTHQIQGKVNFTSWSMDVKIEGENAVRHLDLTLHNEMSLPANTPTWPYLDKPDAMPHNHACKEAHDNERKACASTEVRSKNGALKVGPTQAKRCSRAGKACREAQRCMLQTYSPNRCCKGEQPHHLIEVHCFSTTGARGSNLRGFAGYDMNKAPCVCATGPRHDKEHGALHAVQQQMEARFNQRTTALKTWPPKGESKWTYKEAKEAGTLAHSLIFPGCNPLCTEKQLDNYHKQKKPNGPEVDNQTPVRSDPQADTRSQGTLTSAQQKAVDQATAKVRGIGSTGATPV